MTAITEQDLVILKHVSDGCTTVREIVEASSLTRRQVDYSIEEKLEVARLVEIDRRDGWETTEKDGKEINHWAAKRISITPDGVAELQDAEVDLELYTALTHDELVREHLELKQQVAVLDRKFQALAKRYQRLMDE